MRKIMLFLTAIVLLSSVFGGFSLCEVPNETVALASQEEVAITTLLSKTEYSITYYLNDGINNENNPLTYTIENGIIELYQPTKENHIFVGWKDEQGNYLSAIDTASVHCDLVLYAEWSIEE